MTQPLIRSEILGFPCRSGKVRDVYDLGDFGDPGDQLVIIASDRISAFDWVLPTPIPDKGRILTELSCFWFNYLGIPNHLVSTKIADLPEAFRQQESILQGRTMLVRKTEVVPFECVVRGYLAGSGWKEYCKQQTVCGIPLPAGLQECQQLPKPIF